MEEITIEGLCKAFSLTQTDLAIRLDCSPAAVSKIKNNQVPISDDIQFKVNEKFKGAFKLINDVARPKDFYYNRKEKYEELEAEKEEWESKYFAEHKRVLELEKVLSNIVKYAAGGIPFAGRRKKPHDE